MVHPELSGADQHLAGQETSFCAGLSWDMPRGLETQNKRAKCPQLRGGLHCAALTLDASYSTSRGPVPAPPHTSSPQPPRLPVPFSSLGIPLPFPHPCSTQLILQAQIKGPLQKPCISHLVRRGGASPPHCPPSEPLDVHIPPPRGHTKLAERGHRSCGSVCPPPCPQGKWHTQGRQDELHHSPQRHRAGCNRPKRIQPMLTSPKEEVGICWALRTAKATRGWPRGP